MRIDVVSLFPELITTPLSTSIMGRAQEKGSLELHAHDLREHGIGRHRQVDDTPYGGGQGMVLRPEPLFEAFDAIGAADAQVIFMTPQGKRFCQADAHRLAAMPRLVFLCGHYEGFDERIRGLADEEVSIGDFVLTGGELPAMVVINGVVRLLPGTVGSAASLEEESHSELLLEHPHYTRPAEFRGQTVPEVLRGGDHGAIARWRSEQQQQRTRERRPDLWRRWQEQQAAEPLRDPPGRPGGESRDRPAEG
jgi:tRNA (guanine-N1)-methyltransferase